MSLDDLLPLIFVAWFLVSLVQRGQRNARRRGRAAPQRDVPAPAPRSAEASQGDTTRPDGEGASGNMLDELERRILDAQRRVADATGGSSGRATDETARGDASRGGTRGAAPTAQASTSTPAASTLPSGSPTLLRPPRPAPPTPPTPSAPGNQGFLGREGSTTAAQAAASGAGSFLGREGVPPRAPQAARPRQTAAKAAREDEPAFLPLRGSDVVRGLVWSTVLGEPVARRSLRRPSSRRR